MEGWEALESGKWWRGEREREEETYNLRAFMPKAACETKNDDRPVKFDELNVAGDTDSTVVGCYAKYTS